MTTVSAIKILCLGAACHTLGVEAGAKRGNSGTTGYDYVSFQRAESSLA